MNKVLMLFLALFFTAAPAIAKTTINVNNLSQTDFKSFSEDVGMALSYQPLSPAAPLGDKLPGFDAGIEVSYVKLDTGASWYRTMETTINPDGTTVDLPDALVIPRLHVQVGLPIIPIDLGVSYAAIPDSDYKEIGYEVKWAVLSGTAATPAVAIRGAYTQLSGVDALDLTTKSVDISISKGILIFVPYGGIGSVWITSTPHSTGPVVLSLQEENIRKTKAFVGTKIKFFPFLNMVLEGDFSNVQEYTARLNVSF